MYHYLRPSHFNCVAHVDQQHLTFHATLDHSTSDEICRSLDYIHVEWKEIIWILIFISKTFTLRYYGLLLLYKYDIHQKGISNALTD